MIASRENLEENRLSIYWERCSFCGHYFPTITCTLYEGSKVCMHCCIGCFARSRCPVPAWVSEVEKAKKGVEVAGEAKSSEKVREVLEELLKKL